MHTHTLNGWRHDHVYVDEAATRGERRTRLVIALTVTMMAAEITAGLAFGSLALLADGWHMATHAAALGLTALAYGYARRHARSGRYTFGTGKVGVLGGYTSAVVLAVVAGAMVWAAVIGVWSWGLLRDSGRVLLDGAVPEALRRAVTDAIEADADNRVADLHLWRVGPRHLAAIVSLVTHAPRPPDHYKRLLRPIPDLAHLTVEVQPCAGEPCLPLGAAAAPRS